MKTGLESPSAPTAVRVRSEWRGNFYVFLKTLESLLLLVGNTFSLPFFGTGTLVFHDLFHILLHQLSIGLNVPFGPSEL